jgi:glycosyltransferase involved in cell wall biosynthesis
MINFDAAVGPNNVRRLISLINKPFVLLLLSDSEAPHTRRWANWFVEKGCEVHLATFNSALDPGYDGVKIHVLWHPTRNSSLLWQTSKSLLILFRLLRLFWKIKPDVIHSHSTGAYSWSAFLLNLRPRIVTPWGTDLLMDIHHSKLNFFLTKFSLTKANLVTTDAKHFLEDLESVGVNSNKLIYLAFGTDTEVFRNDNASKHNMITTIISTRTLNPVHQVGDLIKAIPHVLKLHPQVKFKIIGGGNEFDSLLKLVKDLGVDASVKFTGMLSEPELILELCSSDIYVSTSPFDAGLAGSTAEAMSCELPVIHPNVADNSKWVDESGGIAYPVSDVEALANAINHLVSRPESWAQLGKRNRSKIVSENNLDSNMSRMYEIYKTIAGIS